jgi:hypothetical protein
MARTGSSSPTAFLLPAPNQSLAKQNRKSKASPASGGRYKFRDLLVTHEEVGGHTQADGDHDPADVLLVHFLRVVRAGVTAGQATQNH